MSSPSLGSDDLAAVSAGLAPLAKADPAATVVLIGSAARGRMTWRSDIDLFVITSQPIARLHASPRVHIHHETRAKFLERLKDGEEFASWAVQFGQPLHDPSGWWQNASQTKLLWPDWRQKLAHIGKRMRTAETALRDRDREAAEEELMMAASHCGRAILLERKLFPLSRPELPVQLAGIGQNDLSDVLSGLIEGGTDLDDLKRVFAKIRRVHRRLRLKAGASRKSPPARIA